MIEVIVLSVLQGIAEFLPISSSGHLVLGKSLLGLDVGMRLDIFLHVGTLLAVFAFYWMIVRRLLCGLFAQDAAERKEAWSYAWKIVLSAVPAGVVGVLFNDWIETKLQTPAVVGSLLIVTGVVLTATRLLPRGERKVSLWNALWMGVAQAIAILPGVSRSGMTLAAARTAKIDAEKAAEFSFLMSAPPIAGAALLKVADAVKGEAGGVETTWGLCAVGGLVAAVVGYYSLKVLLKSLKSDRFWLFGPYCLVVGCITIFLA